MPQVLIHTLGCKLNSLESEAYYQVKGNSEQVTVNSEQCLDLKDNSKPSIIIINTCTVTSKADQKARRVIRKALRDYPNAVVIVTGCYAALEPEELKNISRRDAGSQRLLVLKREDVLNFLKTFAKNLVPSPRSLVPVNDKFQFFPEKFSTHTRSFLKIQDGCDNHCTYCRIRLARGKSISLPAEQVLERLKILEAGGYAEAVLTGVNICQYRSQGWLPPRKRSGVRDQEEINLFELLEYLLTNTHKIALRLSSLDPRFVVENLLPTPYSLIPNNRIRPHFHLSIQSCSETVLQRMGRAYMLAADEPPVNPSFHARPEGAYNSETIEKAVDFLRGAKDDPFLACDIIAGFPGETEAEFNETYEFCKKTGFAWIHVFPYSKRPGTPAAAFSGNVKESEVTRRVQLLTELAWQGRRDYVRRWLGRETEVLIERRYKKEERKEIKASCRGISENYLKVLVRYKGEQPAAGTVLRCRLSEESGKFEDFDAIGAEV